MASLALKAMVTVFGLSTINGVVDEGMSSYIATAGQSCSDKVSLNGRDVSCTWDKRFSGGRQANTGLVTINGQKAVLKETSDPSTRDNLLHEVGIVKKLQAKHFTKMPEYFLDFQPKQPGSQVVVMEFLNGWFDLNSNGASGETPAVREVRAAAFFVALDEMYKAQVSHCDLNPGNTMFKKSDPTAVKIIDFGMSEVNYGLPGTCNSMSGLPDLGGDGAAWTKIYAGLHGDGTLGRACGARRGRGCGVEKWKYIVAEAHKKVANFRAQHQMVETEEDPQGSQTFVADEPLPAPVQPQPVHMPIKPVHHQPEPETRPPRVPAAPTAHSSASAGPPQCAAGAVVKVPSASRGGRCTLDKTMAPGFAHQLPCTVIIECDGANTEQTITKFPHTIRTGCPDCRVKH